MVRSRSTRTSGRMPPILAISSSVACGAAGTNVSVVSTTDVESGIPYPAEQGSFWLDLTGDASNSDTEGVEQTVSTTIGDKYTLTFWVGNVDNPGATDRAIDGAPETRPVPLPIHWVEFHWPRSGRGDGDCCIPSSRRDFQRSAPNGRADRSLVQRTRAPRSRLPVAVRARSFGPW